MGPLEDREAEKMEADGWELNRNGEWVKDVTPDPDSLARSYMREDGTTYDGFWNPAGNRCFVATSAFENENHPVVATLREYRDRVLPGTLVGKAIRTAYYDWGLGDLGAAFLDQLPTLGKPLVRKLLTAYAHFVAKPAIREQARYLDQI